MNNVNKYYMLKMCAEAAYKKFDENPTKSNSDAYGFALNELRDFCVDLIDELVISAPELVSAVDVKD